MLGWHCNHRNGRCDLRQQVVERVIAQHIIWKRLWTHITAEDLCLPISLEVLHVALTH
jgi:hypothetical protein